MVAQEHFSTTLAETVFVVAAQCAKSIGINQWQRHDGLLSNEKVREGQNVSYCLYLLDKTFCWAARSGPAILMSDISMEPRSSASDQINMPDLMVKVDLAKIEENIYFEIYASQVKPRTEDQVRRLVSKLSQRLEDWLFESQVDLEEVENVSEISSSKIELAAGFLSAQLLLIWPFKNHPDSLFHQCPNLALRCMKLLLRLWHSSGSGYLAIFSL